MQDQNESFFILAKPPERISKSPERTFSSVCLQIKIYYQLINKQKMLIIKIMLYIGKIFQKYTWEGVEEKSFLKECVARGRNFLCKYVFYMYIAA